MPQGVVQELTRILSAMLEQGLKCAWLSEENRQALGRAGHPVQPQLPVRPAVSAPARETAFRPQLQATPASQPAFRPQPQATPASQPAFRPQPQTAAAQPGIAAANGFPPQPVQVTRAVNADALDNLATMKDLLEHCQRILLAGARLVAPQGQTQARLVFVGDYPNADEAVAGRLLVGKAGTMLRKMAEAMGLHWQEGAPDTAAYATTILKYRPTAMPSDAELQAWLPILEREIALVRPQALVLLGGKTANLLLEGQPAFSKICGTIQKYRKWPALVIQTPVQIIRFESLPEQFIAERRQAWVALQQLMSLLGLSRPK
ncbi:MAG: hypothetical protein IJJ33_13315 [Victivallales bacterium]|nr:hypothetical protein [Victivallales bacterium]